MKPLLSEANLNLIRESLYGRNARLVFFKMTPVGGEEPVLVLNSGWHASREKRDRLDGRNNRVLIWISRDASTNNIRDLLNVGSKIDVTFDVDAQSYRIMEIRTMSQLHSGWVVNCEPVESATGF